MPFPPHFFFFWGGDISPPPWDGHPWAGRKLAHNSFNWSGGYEEIVQRDTHPDE